MPFVPGILRFSRAALLLLCLFAACDNDSTAPPGPVESRCVDYSDYMHWVRAIPLGKIDDIAMAGNYACVIGDGSFRIVDMSRYHEEVLATLPITSYASAVTVAGNLAFVCENYDLSIIDLTSPLSPRLRSRPKVSLGTADVAVLGHYAYVTTLESPLTVIDIADPDAPKIGARLGGSPGHTIELQDSIAYVGASGSLLSVDLSQPDAPRLIGSLSTDNHSVSAIALAGGYAYVSAGPAVYVVDISNPTTPRKVTSVPVTYSMDNVLNGTTLYSFTGYGSLDVIDVSKPDAPVKLGTLVAPRQPGVTGIARGMAVKEPYLYVSAGGDVLQEFDLMFPRWPQPAAREEVRGNHIALSGSLAFVADYRTVSVVDVSAPGDPHQRGSVQVDEMCTAIAADGTTAYAGNWMGIDVISAASPIRPAVVTSMRVPEEVAAICPAKPYLYVVAGYQLFVISDLDSLAPQIVGDVRLSSGAADLVTSGSFAYVAGNAGLDVVDVSSPARPSLIATNPEMFDAESVAWIGSQLVVSMDDFENTGGLFIVDVSNPWNPVVVDRMPGTDRVAAHGEYIYNMSYGSLYITHARSGRGPVMVGNFPVDASDLVVNGSWLYAAGAALSVYPLQCEDR